MMNEQQSEGLTEIGQRRRDAMLGELTRHMSQVHRTRLRRRSAALGLLLVLGAAILLLSLPLKRGVQISEPIAANDALVDSSAIAEVDSRGGSGPRPIEEPALLNITVVSSDPSIVERYRIDVTEYTHIRVHHLSDEELLRELAAMGRPTGMISMGGRTWLTEEVTDEALGRDPLSPQLQGI